MFKIACVVDISFRTFLIINSVYYRKICAGTYWRGFQFHDSTSPAESLRNYLC